MSGLWGSGMRGEPIDGYIPKVDAEQNPGGAVLEAFFEGMTLDGRPISLAEREALAPELIAMMIKSPGFLATLKKGRISKEGE